MGEGREGVDGGAGCEGLRGGRVYREEVGVRWGGIPEGGVALGSKEGLG